MSKPKWCPQEVWEQARYYWRKDGCSTPTPNTYARAILDAKREAYEDAAKLLDEGYDREVGKYYRKDRLPSKNDECLHGWYVYEDCESCAAAAIRAKAEGLGE